MTKEQLVALGLDETQIAEVFKLHGLVVNPVKTDLSTKEAEVKTLQGQIKTANDEIEKFKKLDVEGIQKAADDYKTKYEDAEKKAKEDLETLQFEHNLDLAIKDAKAKDLKSVKVQLDLEELKKSKNQEEDIKKALKTVIEEKDFLFENEEASGTGGSKGAGDKSNKQKPITKEQFDAMDYVGKRKLYNTDVELYRELAK